MYESTTIIYTCSDDKNSGSFRNLELKILVLCTVCSDVQ